LIIFSIITSLFVLYFYLLKGISLKDIHYKFINIEKLYIKIDKKIILKAKNIDIHKISNKKSDNKINFKETTKLIKKTLQYLSFFQEINIRNLNINNNKIDLLSLHKKTFTIDTNEIFLTSSLTPTKNKIFFKIYELNIKPIDLIFNNISGNLHSDLLFLYLNITNIYKDTKLNISLKISNNDISYQGDIKNISLKTLTSLSFIKKYITKNNIKLLKLTKISFEGNKKNINLNIKKSKAIIKNINISSPIIKVKYDITKNYGNINTPDTYIDIDKKNIHLSKTAIKFDLNTYDIKIKNELVLVKLNDTNIKLINNYIIYENNIPKFNSDFLILKKSNLYAILENLRGNYNNNKVTLNFPILTLKNNDLNASIKSNLIRYNTQSNKIFIKNATAKINYKTLQDIQLSNIKNYININKKQLISTIKTIKLDNININDTKIIFKNNIVDILFETNTLLSQKLTSILKQFNINIPIYQKTGKNDIKAKISYNLSKEKLHTNLKIIVDKSKLMLTKASALDIHHSELELTDNNISLKNTTLDYNISIVNLSYKIDSGLINLDKSYIKTNGKFIDLNITDIVELKDYPEKLYIDLNGIDIFLKNLKTSVLIHNDIIVNINKLSKFYPYIKYLQEYNLNDGNIKVIIADNIDIITHITDTNQTILEQNLTPLQTLEVNTTIYDNITSIKNKNLDINISKENNLTKIIGIYKNLDINITKFIEQNNTEDNTSINIKTNITAKNTYILYNDLKLYSNKLLIQSNTQYNKTFAHINSLYKDRNITLLFNDGELKLYGLKIKEKTFKDLTNTSFLNKPLLDLYVYKTKNSEILQGFIDIQKGYIKELKAFTNVVAFINLIPSLVTFQALGFTSKGYKIKHGYIEYIFYNKILYFKTITIKGENLTFDGQGYINLNKNTIKMNVNVNLLIKLVKDIPIVGYILLGEDGGVTLKLTIDGNLKDPKVDTNTASNIIEAPLGIIKRALLTPFRPFMEDK